MTWNHLICDDCWGLREGIWAPSPVPKKVKKELSSALFGAEHTLNWVAATVRWPGVDLVLYGYRKPVRLSEDSAAACCFCAVETTSGIYVRHDPGKLDCDHSGETDD